MTHPVIELPLLSTGAARRRGHNRTVEAATEGALRFDSLDNQGPVWGGFTTFHGRGWGRGSEVRRASE